MNRGITKENMLFTLPPALKGDASTEALAEATAEMLADRLTELDRLRIISNIDELDGPVLDILAYDFKVDWWDADYSLAEKRRTLKDSWRVHKTLGTKAAVEAAISAIYPNTKVQEWFEYGGEPYHFKILLDLTGTQWSDDRPRKILERSEHYKSLRSHLEAVEFVRGPDREEALHIGGAMSVVARLPVPEAADELRFEETVRAGGRLGAIVTVPVPELRA